MFRRHVPISEYNTAAYSPPLSEPASCQRHDVFPLPSYITGADTSPGCHCGDTSCSGQTVTDAM
ncbi:hypothetical protein, partial [Escherichia coli]|uniref:hypothetical protein n=1 Tax=Escherichia coli TaxID=562 RepID=UPI00406BCF93